VTSAAPSCRNRTAAHTSSGQMSRPAGELIA
jgi:hypothetical protein